MISKGLSEEVTFWLSHNSKTTMNRQQRKVVQTEGKVSAKAMGKETALCILRTQGWPVCLGWSERARDRQG